MVYKKNITKYINAYKEKGYINNYILNYKFKSNVISVIDIKYYYLE